jgi:small-conductance mechanosensitive channel
MKVKSWLGLLLAPLVVLVAQSTLYSMVTPSCSQQMRLDMHIAAAVALVIVAILAVLAFAESSLRRGEPALPDHDGAHHPVPRRFLADMAAAVAILSCLVILAMWFALWVLGPCDIF